MRIQHAPQAISSDVVVAWREDGGYWNSANFNASDGYYRIIDSWISVILAAEFADECYYSTPSGDITRNEAEKILKIS